MVLSAPSRCGVIPGGRDAQGALCRRRWVGMDAPSLTRAADLAVLRERLDDLARRREAALERPVVDLTAAGRRQLEAMRFELAEVEWHLAQFESR